MPKNTGLLFPLWSVALLDTHSAVEAT